MARKQREPRVFFPWERRRGVLGALSRARVRQVFAALVVIGVIVFLRKREESAAATRATRAAITNASRAMFAFRADHNGGCPKAIGELVAGGYAREVHVDAWGRPLRLVCPGRRDPAGFDLSSDGPDGVPGGLDRIE